MLCPHIAANNTKSKQKHNNEVNLIMLSAVVRVFRASITALASYNYT